MNWTEYLKFQEKTPTNSVNFDFSSRDFIYDGHTVNNGRGVGEWLTPQVVHSKPEYTVIDETEETVFVQDENGAPHVFTREEWAEMQGTGGAGLLAVVAIAAAGLLLL